MEWQQGNLPRGASLPFWPLTSFQRERLSLTVPASCHFFPTLCPTLEIWIFLFKERCLERKQTMNSQQKIHQSLLIWSCQIFQVLLVRLTSDFQRLVSFHFIVSILSICPYDLLLSLPFCDLTNLTNSPKLTQIKVWNVLTQFWKAGCSSCCLLTNRMGLCSQLRYVFEDSCS